MQMISKPIGQKGIPVWLDSFVLVQNSGMNLLFMFIIALYFPFSPFGFL